MHPIDLFPDLPAAVAIAATVAVAYLVLGLTAFGSALIAVPLLAAWLPLREVVPLMLALDFVALLAFGSLNLRQVRWSEVRALLPGIAAGALLAAALAATVPLPRQPMLLVLGLGIVWVAIAGLRPRRAATRGWPAALRGATAGAIETWFGTAGPVLAAALVHRVADVAALRATLGVAILATAAVAFATYVAGGAFDARQALRAALLMPLALVAVALGHRLAQRIDATRVRRAILLLLALSGSVLAGRATIAMLR